VAGYVVPLARASRRPPISPDTPPLDPDAPPPTFTVLVAARDEANVLPALVRDVAAQDHRSSDGSPLFEMVVVDDRSTDGTGDAVAESAAAAGIAERVRVIRRDGAGLPDGKGAALTAGQPDACTGDVVVVLDADARIGPEFLGRLARYVAAGAVAITARRRILDAEESWLAGAQSDEQTLDGEIQRGRWALGGCSEFRGNGIVVRRDLLSAVGGWHAEALTEDLDLSSRIAAEHGATVAWALDAEVWEEPVRSGRGLWQQRDRWAEGAVRRAFEHAPRVLRSGVLSRFARADFAVYVGQLAVPAVILGAIAGAATRRRPGPALILLGSYLFAGGVLAWDGLRWEVDPEGRPLAVAARAGRALRVALFSAVWLVTIPGALWRVGTRRGEVAFAKMAHLGSDPGPVPRYRPRPEGRLSRSVSVPSGSGVQRR
jgi:cellulose synthase/poly-beta-1,6-N-acetylglucosamine synthase-like glycosyltransferase